MAACVSCDPSGHISSPVGQAGEVELSALAMTLLLLWWWSWLLEVEWPSWSITSWINIVQEAVLISLVFCPPLSAAFSSTSCILWNSKTVRTINWIMLFSSPWKNCCLWSLRFYNWGDELPKEGYETFSLLGRRKSSKITNFLKQSHELSCALQLCLSSYCECHSPWRCHHWQGLSCLHWDPVSYARGCPCQQQVRL